MWKMLSCPFLFLKKISECIYLLSRSVRFTAGGLSECVIVVLVRETDISIKVMQIKSLLPPPVDSVGSTFLGSTKVLLPEDVLENNGLLGEGGGESSQK